MFLFDSAVASDWATMEREVKRLLDRIQATLLVCVKFDERKLAFEIRHRKRGTYVLAYFDAAPEKISELDRDARLSDLLLRHVVIRPENLTEERLAQLRAHPAETPLSPLQSSERRSDDERGDRGDRGGRGRRDRDRDRGREGEAPAEEPAEAVEATEI
jgi:small subunit ribosomal protein S6